MTYENKCRLVGSAICVVLLAAWIAWLFAGWKITHKPGGFKVVPVASKPATTPLGQKILASLKKDKWVFSEGIVPSLESGNVCLSLYQDQTVWIFGPGGRLGELVSAPEKTEIAVYIRQAKARDAGEAAKRLLDAVRFDPKPKGVCGMPPFHNGHPPFPKPKASPSRYGPGYAAYIYRSVDGTFSHAGWIFEGRQDHAFLFEPRVNFGIFDDGSPHLRCC